MASLVWNAASQAPRLAWLGRLDAEASASLADEVGSALREVCEAYGVPVPSLGFTQKGNAHGGRNGVTVNLEWLRGFLDLFDPAQRRGVLCWVMAHEVAHCIHGDNVGVTHPTELRADYHAGRILRRIGEQNSVIDAVLRAIAPTQSWEHPPFADRLSASQAGFDAPRWLGQEPAEADPTLQAALTPAEMRAGIVEGFRQVFGRDPTLREAQFAQAVACVEGNANWTPNCQRHEPLCCDGVGSWNFGAIQKGMPPCDPADSFECVDHRADGSEYRVCFKTYASAADGLADLVRVLYKQRPKVLDAAAGGIREFAETMRATKYFEAPASTYAEGLTRCLRSIAKALNEDMPPETTTVPELPVVLASSKPGAARVAVALALTALVVAGTLWVGPKVVSTR